MRVILVLLLVVDCVQIGFGLAALVRSRRDLAARAPSHARFSLSHGLILLAGAVLLAVPVILGLAGTISADAAVYAAIALEVVAFLASRPAVKRLEAAHLARRPAAG